MATEQRAAHSPLGASGAERWMNCPGSVALLRDLKLPESDDPDYRSLGTSAHEVAATCLADQSDAWEKIGQMFGKHVCDQEMSEAVQMYLDECRGIIAQTSAGQAFIEEHIDAPEFHQDFYGTTDFGYFDGSTLFVRDYKHGEGIAVDAEWNPQVMYYAFGLLRRFPNCTTVDMGIVQPRAFHGDGPIRKWTIDADSIRGWANDTLRPLMDRTSLDADLDAGKWCRFCPAKLVCPLMNSLFGAAMQTDPKQVVNLSDEALDRSYQYIDGVKFFLGEMEKEAFRRLNAGHGGFVNAKLVQKKSNRVFKPEAEAILVAKFGDEAYSKPELKTPPEIEKLGTVAKELVKELAYKPDTGLTVAGKDDKRPAIVVKSIKETFGGSNAITGE